MTPRQRSSLPDKRQRRLSVFRVTLLQAGMWPDFSVIPQDSHVYKKPHLHVPEPRLHVPKPKVKPNQPHSTGSGRTKSNNGSTNHLVESHMDLLRHSANWKLAESSQARDCAYLKGRSKGDEHSCEIDGGPETPLRVHQAQLELELEPEHCFHPL